MFENLIGKYFRNEAEKNITKWIDELEGSPIGESDHSKIYASYNELNEYKFLKFKLLSSLNVSTFDGCEIKFVTDKRELKIHTGKTEIMTLFSRTRGQGITEFEIDLEEDLKSMIDNETLKMAYITFKKKSTELPISNQEYLKSIIQ